MKPMFFESPEAFRGWLEEHGATEKEIWVAFHRKELGRTTMTYAQALDEVLCYGWIDGIRKRLDDTSYTNRFTPRKPSSIWSLVNLKHMERLKAEGKMRPAGLAALARRRDTHTGVYSFENPDRAFSPAQEKQFKAYKTAWTWWLEQPPGYRRQMISWVVTAKQEITRAKRMKQLIDWSKQKQRAPY